MPEVFPQDVDSDRILFVVKHPGIDRVQDARGDLVPTSSEHSLGADSGLRQI